MKVGFVGTGNMGGALAKAAAKVVPGENIYLYDRCQEKAQQLADSLHCQCSDLHGVSQCTYIFLGVKPQVMPQMMEELSGFLKNRQDEFVLVSMAAGVPMARIQELAGEKYPVIRIMPNMPVSVGAGMIQYDVTENVTEAMEKGFVKCMECAGVLDKIPEPLINAGTSVASCGPAFAFLFMESLTQGGVACGLSEEKAMLYAKQMLLGSAKLALESDMTPAQLREAVCSPGGSTIEGVKVFEKEGLRDITEKAVLASYYRNIELGK